MPDSNLLLRQAVQAARAGKELTARDLFLDVVKLDPNNKLAWLWLIGLLDDLEDRLAACERVLAIDPAEVHARRMLGELLEKRRALAEEKNAQVVRTLDEAEGLLKKGEREAAFWMLRNLTHEHVELERGWLLLAEASPDMAGQTNALAQVVNLNPKNDAAAVRLRQLRALQNDPYDLAHFYEERGEVERALETYKSIALHSNQRVDFDRVYNNITRLERLRIEKIKHVSPVLSLVRLAAGPPILYIVAMLVHYGLQPWYAPFIVWLAFLMVIAGSFFSALSVVRGNYRIWSLFGEEGTSGSKLTRVAFGFAGFVLIVASFVPLATDALGRLSIFYPPALFR